MSVLHDNKFDDETDAKLASTRYSFTVPHGQIYRNARQIPKKISKRLRIFLENFTLNLGKVEGKSEEFQNKFRERLKVKT